LESKSYQCLLLLIIALTITLTLPLTLTLILTLTPTENNGGDNDHTNGNDDVIDIDNSDNGKHKNGDRAKEKQDKVEEHSVPKETLTVIRPTNINYREMAETGKMIKRILDHGRIEHLRSLGLVTKQLKYCEPVFSPECVMIIGVRRKKK
jgi:hypothetical protein